MKTTTIISAAIFLAILGGCADQRIGKDKYQQAVEGKSTKAEVVALFGAPTITGMSGNDEVLTWNIRYESPTAYIPFASLAGNTVAFQSCIFTFRRQVLSNKGCTGMKP